MAGRAQRKAERAKKRPGRPPKFAQPRISLSFRMQARAYAELKQAAAAAGRSISEEIELRLDKVEALESENARFVAQFGAMMSNIDAALNAGFAEALRQRGFRQVLVGEIVAWVPREFLSPETSFIPTSVTRKAPPSLEAELSVGINAAAIASEIQPALSRALAAAFQKFARKGDDQ